MRRREPARPVPVPAGVAMLAADTYADRPFGGHDGEALPEAAAAPAAAPPQPVSIPPPDWDTETSPAPTDDPGPPVGPVDRMLAEDSTDDDWPSFPAPPLVYEPLRRPQIPEVDWRAEAIERALQPSAETEALEPATPPPSYPAPKK